MTTRKRNRQSLPEDLDEDELSPTKNKGKEVQGSLKKRKLNAYGSSPPPNTLTDKGRVFFESVGGRVGSKLSGLFGLGTGKGKENVQPEDVDELSGDIDTDKEQHIWDVPDNVEALVSRRKSVRGTEMVQKEEAVPNDGDISEGNVPDTGEEPETPSKTRAKRGPKSTSKTVTKLNESNEKANATPKRSAGRPKIEAEARVNTTPRQILRKEHSIEGYSASTSKRLLAQSRKSDVLKRAKATDRAARRKRMSQPGQGEEEEESQPDDSEVLKKRRMGRVGETGIEDRIAANEVSTDVARGRGRPKKRLEDIIDSVKVAPKGILTPRKRRGIGRRKKVAFKGNGEVQLDLGFKDIDTRDKTHLRKKGRMVKTSGPGNIPDAAESEPTKTLEKVEDSPSTVDDIGSEDDDAACAICKGLDSEEPNEIIFCDSCDNAFHQKCYGVSVVPEGDWLCRDCRPNVDELLDLCWNGDMPMVEVPHSIPDIENFEEHLRIVQRYLLDKLTGQKRIRLIGHEQEKQKVYQVVEQTVLAGEGNSMLVIGARGCGKSNLVESVISDLSTEHRDNFHVVRLNGFIHTDDKLALKEIWRQLGREMEVDDDLTVKSNHADTLASLLALLSHPSEISENQENQTAKSVVFVLDEFDLFTTHARQTLLYNLFDIAQARKAPIVVLGLTTRVDVIEALEKRVKSRFSHRYVHLSLPRSIPFFWEICQAGLIADTKDLEVAGYDIDTGGLDNFLRYWQSMIEGLYNDDSTFKNLIQAHFYRTKSVSGFLSSCILPIANLSPQYMPLTGQAFALNAISVLAPDSKLHILQGLSELELALLIAAARLDIILDTDTCNFAMAYDEYSSLTSRHKIQTSSTGIAAVGASAKVWGRDIALGAWERLARYDLVVPVGVGGGSARDFGAGGRMWKVDVGLEEIIGSIDGLSGVMAKWCREI